jgi:hypothetical protein
MRAQVQATQIDNGLNQYEMLAAKLQDSRPHPDQDALAHVGNATMNELLDVLADTALEDFQQIIAEGFISAWHNISLRLGTMADKAQYELSAAVRGFDGSEVVDQEIQTLTQQMNAAEAAQLAIDTIRDRAAETYSVQTGERWTPRRGNVRANNATAAMVDARDAMRAVKARKHGACDPGTAVVAFRGAKQAKSPLDASRIFDALNYALGLYPDMALATSSLDGAEQLAIRWAGQKNVKVIRHAANFDRDGKAAPFKINDQMLTLEPVLVLTLSNTLDADMANTSAPFGPALNLGQKAEEKGIRHIKITAKVAASPAAAREAVTA